MSRIKCTSYLGFLSLLAVCSAGLFAEQVVLDHPITRNWCINDVQTIATSGSVTVPAGLQLTLHAREFVELLPGFTCSTGSKLSAVARPPLYQVPVGGEPGVDWFIRGYVDHGPASGSVSDFAGNIMTYSGHNGTDLDIKGFAAMDAGVPVYCARDGYVIYVRDGEPDRNTDSDSSKDPNFVRIRHDDGTIAEYLHLRKHVTGTVIGSNQFVAVTNPLTRVRAGDQIGYVGSSGMSSGPHLHFAVFDSVGPLDPFARGEGFSYRYRNNPTLWSGGVGDYAVDPYLSTYTDGTSANDADLIANAPLPVGPSPVFTQLPGLWQPFHSAFAGSTFDILVNGQSHPNRSGPILSRGFFIRWYWDSASMSNGQNTVTIRVFSPEQVLTDSRNYTFTFLNPNG